MLISYTYLYENYDMLMNKNYQIQPWLGAISFQGKDI